MKQFINFLAQRLCFKNKLSHEMEKLSKNGKDPLDSSLEREEQHLLENIARLRHQTAKDLAIARSEIVAFSIDTPFPMIAQLFLETGHARVPLFEGQLDNIIGYIHARDLLHIKENGEDCDIRKLVHDILFIVPSMRLLDLMIQMRETKIPMAIMVDEYGDVDGLITIWDIIREVIGNVSPNDHHEEKAQVTTLSDGSYIIPARMDLDDFEDLLGHILTEQERDKEDLDTVGGLITFLAGRVPARRELLKHSSGITFEILEADPRRVIRIRVHPEKKTVIDNEQ